MAKFKAGKRHPFYGRHLSEEAKQKLSLLKKGKPHPNPWLTGNRNPLWKEDATKLSNTGIHKWVRKHLPQPELCQICNLRPSYDLANMTNIYDREFTNWKYLCRKCHMVSDGRIANLELGRLPMAMRRSRI